MNKLIYTVLLLLALTLTISIIPTESEAKIYSDTVRLHILANSDSEEDQKTKLLVRDFVLKNYASELSSFGCATEAKEELQGLLQLIEGGVNCYLSRLGVKYQATVTLTEEWYDTREYGDYTLPRGIYSSLRVLLGDAGGKNWWCVMYPPMCLDLALEGAPLDDGIVDYTKEEAILISKGKYSVKFKLLELVSEAMKEISKNG